MVFLFWLAAGISYRVTCKVFDISRTTAFDIAHRVLRAIIGLTETVIRKPDLDELLEVGLGFSNKAGNDAFQMCAGAIDGCQIRILCSQRIRRQYVNRNRFCSIQLQGLVDHTGKFIDIYTGFPGSVHDSRVLRHSSLYRRGTYPPRGFYLIADKGYYCLLRPITVVIPFRNPEDERQQEFNHALNRARVTVEQTFGQMKVRWRSIFTKALEVKIATGVKVIAACAIMHNICLSEGDVIRGMQLPPQHQPIIGAPPNAIMGENFRDVLLDIFQPPQAA